MSRCAKHPNVETALRCSRCEKYICPKCAIATTVGYRCRECALEKSVTHTVPPHLSAAGSITGFVCGAAASLLVPVVIGYFVIFLGAVVGRGVGELVYRVMGRRSSVLVGAVTALGFFAGAVFPSLRVVLSNPSHTGGLVLDLWAVVFAAVAGGVAWHRLR
jgi:hypothetical protein